MTGCSSVGGASSDMGGLLQPNQDAIKVETDPPGATVYVLGKQIGITPLMLSPNDIFPVTYPRGMQSQYGKITLKKTGCGDLVLPVTQKVMSVGLHARLDCGGTTFVPSGVPMDAQGGRETVEERLEGIKALLNKGLITEEEAKKARERVLNEL